MKDKVRLYMITGLVFLIIAVILSYFKLYMLAALIAIAAIPDFYKAVRLNNKK